MGTMNTRKQTEQSRMQAIKELESGSFRKQFDYMVAEFEQMEEGFGKDLRKRTLSLKVNEWGILDYPEERQHVLNTLQRLGIEA